MKSPPKKEKRTVTGALIQTESSNDPQQYQRRLGLQTSCEIQWRREAHRLAVEYRRTRNPAHLRAFHVHRAAMGGRMHSRKWGAQ